MEALAGNFKELQGLNKERRKSSITEFTEGLLNGKKKSLQQVSNAIRTGVRLGAISKEAALNSK